MAQWWKRYEPILEQRPVTVSTALKGEIAKELVEVVQSFPPPKDQVAFNDERSRARFEAQLEHMPRPDVDMVKCLCTLLRFELDNDLEASAHFFRNERFRAACPTPQHEAAFHFLWPYLLELLHQRKEDCQGHLKRKDLPDILDDFESRFIRARSRIILPS